jgi:two-component system, OmpR family, sensor histidine kinase CpxA
MRSKAALEEGLPMKVRVPLLPRILVWLFLNLLVLGAAFYCVLKFQFRFGLDSLLAGRVGERIQAVSDVIAGELKAKPVSDWNDVLQKFGKAYKVQFLLFRRDGTQVTGESVVLPEAVSAKICDRRGPGEGMGRGPPAGKGPRRSGSGAGGEPQARFIVHTEGPARYWVGVGLPLVEPETSRGWPLTLLLVSDSLTAGGLFLDPTPWVIVGFGALLFSVLFWLPLVRGVTRSLSQMTRATEQISEGRFEARVDERRGDELGRLGQAINRMAGRLAGFVTGQKRFLGDIAHELCSPIARIQVALGILEQRADEKQQTYVNDLREEVEQMSRLVNELLSFSKAGLTPKEISLEAVNLAATARRVLELEAAQDGQVQLQIPDYLSVLAQPELLFRALANLVRNAVRYAGDTGPITVSATRQNGVVVVTVADQGRGVAEASLQQIFDPFFRAEASRSRDTGGIGLGLAIVKTCIEACQGTVSARNLVPHGLEVQVVLKVAP